MLSFHEEVIHRNRVLGKYLCVGLDPVRERVIKAVGAKYPTMSTGRLAIYLREVVDATHQSAATYKPNFWFFFNRGSAGIQVLMDIIRYIQGRYGIPVILDTKTGDIGATSEQAAAAIFDQMGADATTANPYMGQDAIQPLLNRADRGVIFICKTTNPGSSEFQDLVVNVPAEELLALTKSIPEATREAMKHSIRLWELVALKVAKQWNGNHNCGIVVGATSKPTDLRLSRRLVGPDVSLLIPGVGKQGGDLEAAVLAAAGEDRQGLFLVNASTAIGHASDGADYAEAAGLAAQKYNDDIEHILAAKTA